MTDTLKELSDMAKTFRKNADFIKKTKAEFTVKSMECDYKGSEEYTKGLCISAYNVNHVCNISMCPLFYETL